MRDTVIVVLIIMLAYATTYGKEKEVKIEPINAKAYISKAINKAEQQRTTESLIAVVRMLNTRGEYYESMIDINDSSVQRLSQELMRSNTELLEHKIAIETLREELSKSEQKMLEMERDKETLRRELQYLRSEIDDLRIRQTLGIK